VREKKNFAPKSSNHSPSLITGIWGDTLTVLLADNGGTGSGSNWPLRGGKFSLWEGGTRSVALAHGKGLGKGVAGVTGGSGEVTSTRSRWKDAQDYGGRTGSNPASDGRASAVNVFPRPSTVKCAVMPVTFEWLDLHSGLRLLRECCCCVLIRCLVSFTSSTG